MKFSLTSVEGGSGAFSELNLAHSSSSCLENLCNIDFKHQLDGKGTVRSIFQLLYWPSNKKTSEYFALITHTHKYYSKLTDFCKLNSTFPCTSLPSSLWQIMSVYQEDILSSVENNSEFIFYTLPDSKAVFFLHLKLRLMEQLWVHSGIAKNRTQVLVNVVTHIDPPIFRAGLPCLMLLLRYPQETKSSEVCLRPVSPTSHKNVLCEGVLKSRHQTFFFVFTFGYKNHFLISSCLSAKTSRQ